MLNSTPGKEARRLRVPLSCIVDYKGFRAMVIAYVDIDALKPELGLYAGDYQFTKRVEDVFKELRSIGIILNLKENRI